MIAVLASPRRCLRTPLARAAVFWRARAEVGPHALDGLLDHLRRIRRPPRLLGLEHPLDGVVDQGPRMRPAHTPPPIDGHSLEVLSDGRHAVVADGDRDRVLIVDLSGGEVAARIADTLGSPILRLRVAELRIERAYAEGRWEAAVAIGAFSGSKSKVSVPIDSPPSEISRWAKMPP